MAAVAAVVNLICLRLLNKMSDKDVNLRAATTFSFNDFISNGGIIIAAIIVMVSGANWPDLVVGIAVAGIALYGGIEALELARSKLPALTEIHSALDTLETLQRALPQLPLSFDLADLRGYNYHNGVVFDAYFKGYSSAVAQGGRYDGVGRSFGRARPATGFSMDLRSIAALAEDENITGTILAPFAPGDTDLKAAVDTLREAGRIVVELLPGEIRGDELPCAGQLVQGKEGWIIQAINED